MKKISFLMSLIMMTLLFSNASANAEKLHTIVSSTGVHVVKALEEEEFYNEINEDRYMVKDEFQTTIELNSIQEDKHKDNFSLMGCSPSTEFCFEPDPGDGGSNDSIVGIFKIFADKASFSEISTALLFSFSDSSSGFIATAFGGTHAFLSFKNT